MKEKEIKKAKRKTVNQEKKRMKKKLNNLSSAFYVTTNLEILSNKKK